MFSAFCTQRKRYRASETYMQTNYVPMQMFRMTDAHRTHTRWRGVLCAWARYAANCFIYFSNNLTMVWPLLEHIARNHIRADHTLFYIYERTAYTRNAVALWLMCRMRQTMSRSHSIVIRTLDALASRIFAHRNSPKLLLRIYYKVNCFCYCCCCCDMRRFHSSI